MNLGKNLLQAQRNMKPTKRNVLKSSGVLWNVASLTFVIVLSFLLLDHPWLMKHFFVEIVEHTDWLGRQVHQLLRLVFLEAFCPSPSLT